jgi:3-phytase
MKRQQPYDLERQFPRPPLLLTGLTTVAFLVVVSCSGGAPPPPEPQLPEPEQVVTAVVEPVLVTDPVAVDSDDPAIWINPTDPLQSLVIGTDKGGSLYVFNLDGAAIPEKTFDTGGRMNNVDVEYGLPLGEESIDIAVATDRPVSLLRVLRLPEMTPVDNGGIPVFEGEEGDSHLPMGIALYKRPSDGAVFAIVSRKTGPSGAYLWQYRLADDGNGHVTGTKVREFGTFSDATSIDEEGVAELGEIESVAVDDALGYVYYSDELTGIRKYHADPDAHDADVELALFGTDGFADQREGISIYTIDDGTGYILVSDQQGNAFRIFKREGEPGDPHDHRLVKIVKVSTNESDGSEVTSVALGERFPSGLFVAMSDNKTFQYYSWDDIAGDELVKAPNGAVPAE